MNVILDTHAVLWASDGSPRLSDTARDVVSDPANRLYFSMAGLWEMAIKTGLGKLTFTVPFEDFLQTTVVDLGISLLPITVEDCIDYRNLTFPDPTHRDPYDRMIVVQAKRHHFSIVSVDPAFDAYGVNRVW